MEMHYSRLSVPFAIWILLLMAMVLVGCKSAETPAPAELVIGLYVGTVLVIVEEYIEVAVMVERTLPPFEVPPEPPLPPNHSSLIAAREGSPNAKAIDLGKGPKIYCSRCHSSQNWDPVVTTGVSPNCVTRRISKDPSKLLSVDYKQLQIQGSMLSLLNT